MCIVTYLPLSGEEFILISSREEIPSRASSPPSLERIGSIQNLYPKDLQSNGTWIIANNKGRTGCLLNGAFKDHSKKESYRHSRGLILLKYLEHKSFMNFYFQYDLREIEPFTLIAYENKSLFELRWDGERHHVKTLLNKAAHIWSSATLYDQTSIQKRELRFQEWIKDHSDFLAEDIIRFHKREKEEKVETNPPLLLKENVKTLSITMLQYNPQQITMTYEDIGTGVDSTHSIRLN